MPRRSRSSAWARAFERSFVAFTRNALQANARAQAGSNPDAAFARGLDALTIRPLLRSVPPDDDWVVVTYRGLDGVAREIRLDWQVAVAGVDGSDGTGLGIAALAAQGLDVEVRAVNEAKKQMFARRAVEAAAAVASPKDPATRRAVRADDLATTMPTVFRARQSELGFTLPPAGRR